MPEVKPSRKTTWTSAHCVTSPTILLTMSTSGPSDGIIVTGRSSRKPSSTSATAMVSPYALAAS
eukprot:scaffold56914_cov63-Phaeocystis_antarctica.AAC.3